MVHKNNIIPKRDANENSRAYRVRMKAEAEAARKKELEAAQEKEAQEYFRRFVTEKKEDFTLTVLGALLQHSKTDKTKIEENVGLATAYADALLSRIYGLKKAADKPVPAPPEAEPAAAPETPSDAGKSHDEAE